jgi:hypothetical protein
MPRIAKRFAVNTVQKDLERSIYCGKTGGPQWAESQYERYSWNLLAKKDESVYNALLG